jgi:hypothetical protein
VVRDCPSFESEPLEATELVSFQKLSPKITKINKNKKRKKKKKKKKRKKGKHGSRFREEVPFDHG